MAHIIGTENPNSLQGGNEADLIEGLGGNDTLRGNGDDDELRGGEGDDWLMGGDGNDVLEGGEGVDRLEGGGGMDTLRGGGGNDIMSGFGNVAGEYVDGGSGIDLITFFGQSHPGFNFSLADPAISQTVAGATIVNVERMEFTGSHFADTITGGAYDDRISGADGADTIDGGGGNDILDGGGTGDIVYGGGGDDYIWQRGGETLIDGGSGVDFLNILYGWVGTLDFSDPSVDQNLAGTTIRNIDRIQIWGGEDANRITGGAYDDSMDGNGGDDILSGGGGNDFLAGGEGLDELRGGAGDDWLTNHEIFNTLGFSLADGGDGVDTFTLGVGSYTGPISIDLLDSTGAVRNVERIELTGGSGVNQVSGAELNDRIWGGDSGDFFQGRGGNDEINGRGGNDVIHGGAGNDLLEGWSGFDTIYGEDGDDDVRAGTGGSYLDGGAGTDTLRGYIGTDTLIGGEGDDLIDGSDGNDELRGGAGSDRLEGGPGTDTFVYGQFSDSTAAAPDRIVDFLSGTDKIDLRALGPLTLAWQAATDPVSGATYQRVTATSSSGDLVLRVDSALGLQSSDFLMIQGATEGDDNLVGTDGDDVIDGLGGNDRIDGLLGADKLSGGAGNDHLYGNGGRDDLLGGAGNDWLYVSGTGIVVADGGADFDYLTVDWGDSTIAITGGYAYPDPNGGLTGSIYDSNGRQVDYSSINILRITTGSGNDLIHAGQAGSSASLGGGDDRYHGAGSETVDGGAGVDGVSAGLQLTASPIVWNLQTNSHTGLIGSYTNFEYFLGLLAGSGNDVVVTTAAELRDSISLGAGDDVLTVLNGRDFVRGELGDDLLIIDYSAATNGITTTGGSAGITLGSDSSGVSGQITDNSGRWVDFFDFDRFDLRTGSGRDLVNLGTGSLVTNDIVSLGDGDDFADFGRGTDQGDGGAGVDAFAADLSLATVAISANLVTNSFSGPANVSFVNFEHFGGLGLRTGSGDDVVVTHQLGYDDRVMLGAGADSATVHHGFDVVDGQAGSDLLIVDYTSTTTSVQMIGGLAGSTDGNGLKGRIGDIGYRRVDFDNIERLDVRTGSGNDVLEFGSPGLATNDIASLGGGNDLVEFRRGIDVGDGGSGVDGLAADLSEATVAVSVDLTANSFSGPAGTSFVNFEYFGGSGLQTGAGADVVVTGLLEQSDLVALGSGDDIVTLYNGWDTVFGGPAGAGAVNSGFDTLVLDYSASTAAVSNIYPVQTDAAGTSGRIGDGAIRVATFQAIDRFVITTGSGNDMIATADGNDEIRTGGGSDSIAAGAGDDLLDGGAGADSMAGGTGNDLYFVDNGADAVAETSGEGTDEVRTSLVAYSLLGTHIENLTASSNVNHDFRGSSANNFVKGGAGDDVLRLQDGGSDIVDAGDGLDRIFFGATLTAADVVNGGAGMDTLALQGAYALYLGAAGDDPAGISGIETILLLSGADTSFGPAAGTSSYQITLTQRLVGSGEMLTIDGSGLGTAEQLYLDARAETDGSLVVKGGAGNDTLLGGGVGSIISGGGGNDQLYAALAGSTLEGGAGADMLFGRQGSDVLRGGDGDDRLADHGSLSSGGGASDSLDGQGGNDIVNFLRVAADVWTSASLSGGDGNDEILYSVESFGVLSIDAGSGNDKISISTNAAATRISLGTGQDMVTLNNHQGLVKPGGSIAISDFETGAGGDKLDWRLMLKFDMAGYTEGRNPFLTGHARLVRDGNDVLLQIDRRTGGTDSGFKTILRFENRNIADFTAANFDGLDPTVGTGTAGADTLRGEAGDDILNAGDGNDILHLWNGGGNDTALGGAGNDNIFFGATLNSADIVNGGDGVDTLILQGPYGSLTLSANVTQIENVSILGGGNTNFGDPGTNRYDYVLTTNDANFAAGVQARINGAALLEGEDFTFDGSAETDAKYVVYGGRGKDTLTGGLGNDIFFYAEERFASGDTVNGGAGYDGMFLRGNYTIDFNAPGYTGLFTNIENLTLTSATDERYARGGGSEFDYNLTLSNAIVKPGETLTISGTILMASETMMLDASQESDGFLRLFGGKANDTLKGGGQADLIHGNLGADILAGNGGADSFRFQETAESNSATMDQILDFTPGTDKIELDRIDANTLAAGDQGFSWIGSSAFSGQAGQLRAYEQGGTWFVEGDTNGDSLADLVIALTLQGPTPLSSGDFLL